MAQYEHLPIYKAAFDLAVYFEEIVRHFSRYNKYNAAADAGSACGAATHGAYDRGAMVDVPCHCGHRETRRAGRAPLLRRCLHEMVDAPI